jgi:hypothetical protein
MFTCSLAQKLYADCDDIPSWVSVKRRTSCYRIDVPAYSLVLVIVSFKFPVCRSYGFTSCHSRSLLLQPPNSSLNLRVVLERIQSRSNLAYRYSSCNSINKQSRLIDPQDTLLSERTHRPRSKSKPDAIFIHPAESNLARADAAALELGLSGSTDRVHGNRYQRAEPAWEVGAGQGAARALLGSANRKTSERDPFLITDDLGSD